jgi:predicted nucleic acid-binding protein
MDASGPGIPRRSQGLQRLLLEVSVLSMDEAVARKFGEVRAWQLDNGLTSPDLDFINGVTALTHGPTLVTHNGADYRNIPGLIVVDWLVP